ncbi:MAG: DUF4012 domain-containing protein [Patescibacteria group bacterium]|nr:DUF4012 domain-containing protein [Patescibacteria group bacterium]
MKHKEDQSSDVELKKITLQVGDDSLHEKHEKKSNRSSMLTFFIKIFLLLIIFVVFFTGGSGIFLYVKLGTPTKTLISQVQQISLTGREFVNAVKTQNIDESKVKLTTLRSQLTDIQKTYQDLLWLKSIPYIGVYIQDGERVLNAGFAGLDAGDKAIAALEPNADLLGLKGKSTFTAGSADERIQIAVKTMTALIPQINAMANDIDKLRKEIEMIDPMRYPEEIRGIKLRSQIVSAKATIENAANLFVNAQPLLIKLPEILGEPKEKRYLILFQNDKELRPTGGFLTAFAQFRFARGKAILERSDDIYKLDEAKRKRFQAPKEILTYHKGVNEWHIRDSNLSPDLKLSMQQFEEMYETVAGREKIDGIITVDTHAFVEFLRVLGPLYIGGREFSVENDPRCDCPKAVYELEDYATRPVNYIRTDRKDIIGVLMQTMIQMALGTSPSKYWGQLFQVGLNQIYEKHIMAYFKDEETQKAVEAFNMAGRIMTKEETAAVLKYREGEGWDYLHVNHSNMAGQKANMFVKESFTKDVTINGDGTITTKLTVDYKNPFPGSDCNLERGGLCLNAPLRNWVRVYVPKGSKLIEGKGTISPSTGKPQEMITYESLGKTVFEGFLIVNPKGIAKLELTYTSPVNVQGKYNLLVQKQPGTTGQEFELRVNGKTRRFTLETDTELTL